MHHMCMYRRPSGQGVEQKDRAGELCASKRSVFQTTLVGSRHRELDLEIHTPGILSWQGPRPVPLSEETENQNRQPCHMRLAQKRGAGVGYKQDEWGHGMREWYSGHKGSAGWRLSNHFTKHVLQYPSSQLLALLNSSWSTDLGNCSSRKKMRLKTLVFSTTHS